MIEVKFMGLDPALPIIWGEGETADDALENAKAQVREFHKKNGQAPVIKNINNEVIEPAIPGSISNDNLEISKSPINITSKENADTNKK